MLEYTIMSQFVDLLKKYVRPYYKVIIAIIVFIVFFLAAYFILKRYNYFESFDVANDSEREGSSCIIYFFHADWCPHCKKAQPEWESFKQSNDGKLVNGYKLSCVGINCTNEDDANTTEYINKFGIEGYPTIKMLKDNKVIDFESRITTSSLNSFLDTMMN